MSEGKTLTEDDTAQFVTREDEAAAYLTDRGYLVLPPLSGISVTATMCPGCGHNRVVGINGEFLPHHVEHDGVSGPVCDEGKPAVETDAEPVPVIE